MGSLFRPSKTTTKTESSPWKPQQEFLKDGFQYARDAFGQVQQNYANLPNYPGMNQHQLGALHGLANHGQQFTGATEGVLNSAVHNASSGPQVTHNPALLRMQLNAGQMARMGPTAGEQQATNNAGMFAQGPTQSQTDQVHSDVSGDKTGQIVSNAGQYAANPYLDGQIDAVLRDINRSFNIESGNINAAAVGSGAVNSTRAGVLDARNQQAHMDRAAAVAANMRGNAWQQGVQTASGMEQQRQNASLAANAQRQIDDQYIQRGILDSTGQRINAEGQRLGAQLGANSQLGTAAGLHEAAQNNAQARFGMALDSLSQAYGINTQGLRDKLAAGERLQQQDLNNLQWQLQKAGLPMALVQSYMQAIGGSFGGTGTQQVPGASPFQQILGGGMALAGGLGKLF